MSKGKLLLGVLAGFAAGALLGILMAPDKGSETRKKFTKKGTDFADDLEGKFDDFMSSVTEEFEKLKKEGKDFVQKEKSDFEEMMEESKTTMK